MGARAGPPRKAPKKETKAKIKTIEDLAGRRVGVVGRTKVNAALLRVILKESGVDPDKVQVTQFGTDQISEMVRDQSVDAFMMVGPSDSKLLLEAITATARLRGEPTFLPIDVSEAIAARHPLYKSEEIPGSTFTTSPARPDDTLETVSVNHLIVAPKSLSETVVGALTRQIFAAKPDLARAGAGRIEDREARYRQGRGAAGASRRRRLYRRHRTHLHGQVQRLHLGRGAAVLGAGLGDRRGAPLHQARRAQAEHPASREIGPAIAQARRIETIQELDTLQCEADDILRETLDCYDDGAIDEFDIAAYGLVLDQFHHAIADRRAALGTPVTIQSMKAAE